MKTKVDMIDYILSMVAPQHQEEVGNILEELLPEAHRSYITPEKV